MRIAMIGTGYVGLVSAACFAEMGHCVNAADINGAKIESLRKGELPIFEPDLQRMIKKSLADGRLSFVGDRRSAVANAEAIFIAVGTPTREGDGKADLSYVHRAAREIAAGLSGKALVILKSTVPVGTADEVEQIIRELRPSLKVAVASNPEFLRAGSAIRDFKRPDRLVIGAEAADTAEKLMSIYRPLRLKPGQILVTSRRSAELIKYAGNAFLATKIAFINEVADLCERVGADIEDVARGVGLDRRIGPDFLRSGPGFGGSCFPKDTLALVKMGEDEGSPVRIIEAVVSVNESRKATLARRVERGLGESLRGKTIAILGLAFKPNTDDLRESPSLSLIRALIDRSAHIRAYDPAAMNPLKELFPEVTLAEDAYRASKGADVLVLMTEWEEFRTLDLPRLERLMARPVIVDMRNMLAPGDVLRHGFTYYGVGRPRMMPMPKVALPVTPVRRKARSTVRLNGSGILAEA
jgi:UDPglucose 6-dehydrogenase